MLSVMNNMVHIASKQNWFVMFRSVNTYVYLFHAENLQQTIQNNPYVYTSDRSAMDTCK